MPRFSAAIIDCLECGVPFVPVLRRGTPPNTCSEPCRDDRRKRLRNEAVKARYVHTWHEGLVCGWCGQVFAAKYPRRCCGDACRFRFDRRVRRLRGVRGQKAYTVGVVVERDGWGCGICGVRVDRLLKYPDPGSASIDHVIPISRGGSDELENLQLAHLGCNWSKGAGDARSRSRAEGPV